MMKKLIFLANIRLPTERAHGLQIMKMCEAYAAEGMNVTLVVPRRKNKIAQDPYEFYSVARSFSVVYIWCPSLLRYGPVGFVASSWLFGLLSVRKAFMLGFDWIYSRDGRAMWVLSWSRAKFLWEAHEDKGHWWERRPLRHCLALVTLNLPTAELHLKLAPKNTKFLIAPSAVTLDDFEISKSRAEVHDELGFSKERKTILYTGHLYKYKGVDILAEAGILRPQHDFVFVGGTKSDVERFRAEYKHFPNLKILGHKAHREVANYLYAADLLVIPNTAKDEFSRLYTSPIKLFEYMASGTPIIASDIPSLREVVDESTCYFFKPDDPQNLVQVIDAAFTRGDEARSKATNALVAVKKYSYTERAKKILNFMNHV